MPTVLLKTFSPNEKEQEFEGAKGLTIFDELERQGVLLPHGCLAGSCGSCRIEVLEGAENLSEIGVVEKDTVESLIKTYCETGRADAVVNKNIRLSCRAKILGDIKISVLK
jgi:ferredoxin